MQRRWSRSRKLRAESLEIGKRFAGEWMADRGRKRQQVWRVDGASTESRWWVNWGGKQVERQLRADEVAIKSR